MASKVPIIVYDYVRRALVRRSEGIASLPNKQAIVSSMQDIFNRLKSGGYNAVTAEKVIKNQDDLRKVLNTIDSKEIADIKKRKEDSERLARVMDKMEKGIPLNPSDQYDKSEGVLAAFQGFKPKVIQGGKSEKELLEKMNKQNKEAVERIKKRKDTDPDKKAEGGRIGYFKGGVAALLKLLQSKVGKKATTTADKIDRPESAKLRDEFKAFEKRMGNRKLTDEEYDDLVEEYGEGVPYDLETVDDAKKYIAKQEAYKAEMASDYRAGKLDPKPGDPNRKKFLEKMREEAEMTGDRRLFTRDEADELESFNMDTEMGEFMKKAKQKDLQQKRALEEFDVTDRTKQAEGGLMRLGFEKGGMSRRGFIKLMGGLAALPVVGKFFKPTAKVVETAGPAVTEGVKLGFDKFMMLVDKIKRLGRKTDGVTQNAREEGYVYTGKDGNEYELVENVTTGDVRIIKDKVGIGSYNDKTFDTIEDRSVFVLKRNQAGETTKGKKPPDEYDEIKEVFGPDGMLKDVDEVSDTAVDEVLEELGETKIKKAGGGLAYTLGE